MTTAENLKRPCRLLSNELRPKKRMSICEERYETEKKFFGYKKQSGLSLRWQRLTTPKSRKSDRKLKEKVADEQLEDEPSFYPKPDDRPDALVSAESRHRAEQRRAMKTKTSRKIRVRRAESVPDSVIRKPTQPLLPVCRRVRAAVSAPPKMSTSTI